MLTSEAGRAARQWDGAPTTRIVSRIEELDARDWNGVAALPTMRHEAIRSIAGAQREVAWVYALASDEKGPLAAIAARPHLESSLMRRAVLEVTPPVGLLGGLQLRDGVALADALPALLPSLARMARRAGCATYSVVVPASDAPLYAAHQFAFFAAPATMRSDLSGTSSYDEHFAHLTSRLRRDVRNARRRSEQHGIRFEVTTPPRGPTDQLAAVVAETYAAYGRSPPFTPAFFDRLWGTPFAEHVLFCGYRGDQLVAACSAFQAGGVLTAAIAGMRYELARPSLAYFTLMDEIVRFAAARRLRTVEWGTSLEDIKRRFGAEPHGLVAALRPSVPMPAAAWRAIRALLRTDLGARVLGEREIGTAVSAPHRSVGSPADDSSAV